MLDAHRTPVTGDAEAVADADRFAVGIEPERQRGHKAAGMPEGGTGLVADGHHHLGLLRREGMEMLDLEPHFVAIVVTQQRW